MNICMWILPDACVCVFESLYPVLVAANALIYAHGLFVLVHTCLPYVVDNLNLKPLAFGRGMVTICS